MSQEKHLRFQYLVVNYERTKLALDVVASSGAGRSAVRLSAGTCQDLVNWHSSFFTGRAAWPIQKANYAIPHNNPVMALRYKPTAIKRY